MPQPDHEGSPLGPDGLDGGEAGRQIVASASTLPRNSRALPHHAVVGPSCCRSSLLGRMGSSEERA